MPKGKPNGQFVQGNQGGPGISGTLSSKLQTFRRIFIERLDSDYTPDPTRPQTLAGKILDTLFQDALNHDVKALAQCIERMLGKALDPDLTEALQALQILKQPIEKLIELIMKDPEQRELLRTKLAEIDTPSATDAPKE